MLFHDFAPRLAQILTDYSHPIQKGDYVVIRASADAEPLILALYEAVLRRGGHPSVSVYLPQASEIFYRVAQDEQLDFLDPLAMTMIEKVDVLYQILAPSNTKDMSTVDPAIQTRVHKAYRPYIEKYFGRIADQTIRWNICAWPTQAAAQEAEMGLLAYTEFIYNACGLNHADPVAYWEGLKARQDRLVAWLQGKKRAEIKGPGIDLSFSFEGRLWVNDWGDNNFPAGEVFTSPVEDSVNGHVAFSYPTLHTGREVSGVKLTFKDGVVVEARAAKGEDDLLRQLDMDEGARRVGEFAIGTNYGVQKFTGETLFDEKIGGTVHMALGESIKEAGGQNSSAIHWDIVHEMKNGGEIYIDGELFYRNGQFVIEGA